MKMKRTKVLMCSLIMVMALVVQVCPVEASTIAPPRAWCGKDAAAYAKKYAKNYNQNYHAWSSDCTNFASQCLAAGGKYMTGYTKPKKGGKVITTSSDWYYHSGGAKNNYSCSTSWIRCSGSHAFANYWYSYKVGTFSKLANVRKNVSVGDVIQITLKNGTLKHSIIVSKKKQDGSEIYCASHTSDYAADSLAAINKRATKSWGKVTYTVFHFK